MDEPTRRALKRVDDSVEAIETYSTAEHRLVKIDRALAAVDALKSLLIGRRY